MPDRRRFDSERFARSVVALPLLEAMEDPNRKVHEVMIDLNLDFARGREEARQQLLTLIRQVVGRSRRYGADERKYAPQYVFATLTTEQIRALMQLDAPPGRPRTDRTIFRIWPDFEVRPFLTESLRTLKADAARISFSAQGEQIVWAVMDSGIEGEHPHFVTYGNLDLPGGLKDKHRDFCAAKGEPERPLEDPFGHGTHVAGIIAGEHTHEEGRPKLFSVTHELDEHNQSGFRARHVRHISGVAPRCKLLSLRVLNARGSGRASDLIAAIAHVQELNGHGRRVVVHGVNMSVGYEFEPEWFACGHSPLCVEVDRLVKSGVVVVTAAGNTGYGVAHADARATRTGLDLTINDPGNAEYAITVGATHREAPHRYGVSYFSSKGPTGDGRAKPDLVAPGEKVVSCAAGAKRAEAVEKLQGAEEGVREGCHYRAESGTSMAAPHVSGAVAAFLSVRREFIGRPEAVKELFMNTATDLGRDRYFQGRGLVDVMRALQSV